MNYKLNGLPISGTEEVVIDIESEILMDIVWEREERKQYGFREYISLTFHVQQLTLRICIILPNVNGK